MPQFTYQALPGRVIFGAGSLKNLPDEMDRLGARRALVLSTPEQHGQALRVAQLLGDRCAGIFDQAVMHVPIETARLARQQAQRLDADCAVAIGGGSTTGLGKAIALDSGLPIIAIPTTYAGSEMTPIYGITEAGVKKTGRDLKVLPKTVIYDPDLSLSLPLGMTITSGLNAIAHAAEGLYSPDGNPITALMAAEGIRALAQSLTRLKTLPADPQARSDALYGAWLCGSVLGAVGMGLHHKLCHTLGGSFNLPHAEVHSVILAHAMAYNASAAPAAMAQLAQALGADSDADADAPQALYRLAKDLGAPCALKDIGMPPDGLDRAADLAVQMPYPNPRPLERAGIRALLQRAYDGAAPQ